MNSLFFWLLTLAGLMLLSAFCSASEAAFFSLTPNQLRTMKEGTASERRAARLLRNPDRLLSTLLFSNLIANMLYFGIVSVFTLKIQTFSTMLAGAVSVGALLLMILLCELLPKAAAVLIPRATASFSSFPILGLQWVTAPLLPVLGVATRLSRRLIVPNFRPEPLLDLRDLDRAVSLAKGRNSSAPREKEVLRALLSLSEITAEEMMRPRTTLPIFEVPLTLEDLRDADRSLGWVFIQEEGEQDAISQALALESLVEIPPKELTSLEKYVKEVLYVPWNQPAAGVLDALRTQNRQIAVIIDEYGATPGVILLSDILETIFSPSSERVFLLTDHHPIRRLSENSWEVSGLYSVRAFCRRFDLEFPENLESTTLGGLVTDLLQKIPETGDGCSWNGFQFQVLSGEEPAAFLLEVQKMP